MEICNFNECGGGDVDVAALIVAVDALTAGENDPHLRLRNPKQYLRSVLY